MENSCREKYKQSPKKWISASSYPEFRRHLRLIPANADLYHYAGNCPVRYIDPDGREDIKYILGQDILDEINFVSDIENNYTFTMCGSLEFNVKENSRILFLTFEESLEFGGILNIYRMMEKKETFNQLVESYSKAKNVRDAAIAISAFFGLNLSASTGAVLFAVDFGVDLFKSKQYEKAADQLASFQDTITRYSRKGYKLSGDILVFSRTKTMRAPRPHGQNDIIDMQKEVHLYARMKRPNKKDGELTISCELKFHEYE
ncbi:MAG: hypothetical protein K6E22_10995 [Treponema sp.]|nr:hypothetical protein [Treponema sp.]